MYMFNFWCEYRSWLVRNAHKEFLIGESSRSHTTYRPTIPGWLLVCYIDMFNPCNISDIITMYHNAQVWHTLMRDHIVLLAADTFIHKRNEHLGNTHFPSCNGYEAELTFTILTLRGWVDLYHFNQTHAVWFKVKPGVRFGVFVRASKCLATWLDSILIRNSIVVITVHNHTHSHRGNAVAYTHSVARVKMSLNTCNVFVLGDYTFCLTGVLFHGYSSSSKRRDYCISFLQVGCPSCRPTNSVRAKQQKDYHTLTMVLEHQVANSVQSNNNHTHSPRGVEITHT